MEALGCHRGCVANARRSWVTATSASTSCCLSETDLSSLSSADLVASLADEVDAIVRHFFALPAHIRLLCSAEARRAAEQAFRCAVDFRDLLHRMAAPTRRSRRRRQHYRQHYPAEEGDVSSSSRTMRDIEIDSTATTGYGRPTGAVTLDSGDNAVDRETKVPCLSAARRGLTGFEASSSMALGGFSNDRREVQLKKRIRRQRGETDGGGEASASSSATVTKPSSSSVDHLDEGESLKGRGKGDRDVPVDDDRRGQYETPKQCPREAECPVSIDDETSVSRGTLSGSIGRRRGPRRDHRHHLWLGLRHLRGGSDGEQQGRDGPVCVHLKARAPSAWGFRRQGGMGEVGRGGGGKASDGPQRQLRVCSECVAPSWRTANSSHPIVQRLQAPLVSVAVGQGGVRGLCGEKTGLCNVCGSVPGRSISTASFSGTEESERDMQAVDYEKKLSAIALSLPFIPLEQRIGVLARVSRAVYRLVYEAPIEYADFRSSFSSSEDDSAESDIGAAAAPPRSPVGNEARHSPLHQPPQLSSSSSSSTLGKQPPFPQERDRDEGDNKTAAASNGAAVDEERHCSPQQWVATSSGRRLRAVQLLSHPVFSRRLAPRLSRLVTLKVRCGDQPLISLLSAEHLKHLELRFSQSDDLVALARWLAAAARASSLRFLNWFSGVSSSQTFFSPPVD